MVLILNNGVDIKRYLRPHTTRIHVGKSKDVNGTTSTSCVHTTVGAYSKSANWYLNYFGPAFLDANTYFTSRGVAVSQTFSCVSLILIITN